MWSNVKTGILLETQSHLGLIGGRQHWTWLMLALQVEAEFLSGTFLRATPKSEICFSITTTKEALVVRRDQEAFSSGLLDTVDCRKQSFHG